MRGFETAHLVAAAGFAIVVAAIVTLNVGTPTVEGQSTQQCNYPKVNVQGVAKADIAVSSAAVTVLAADSGRCSALLQNTGAGDLRCASNNDFTPTSTTGVLLKSGVGLSISKGEATQLWRCIRTSADTTLNVLEVSVR